MNELAGEIAITLRAPGGVVQAVEIASTRPQLAERLLAGKPAAQALALVPRLFTLCGRAQALAAELALHAARGDAADAVADAARVQRVEHEIAQEYLWRVLLDWTAADGHAPAPALLAQARAALAADDRAALCRLAEQAVFGGDAGAWFTADLVRLDGWLAQRPTVAARVLASIAADADDAGPVSSDATLPSLSQPTVLQQIAADLAADDGFARAPTYAGRPAETGAVARLQSHPLLAQLLARDGRGTLTRLVARLLELARIVAGLPARTALAGRLVLPGSGRGVGWVETARGVLVHLIELAGDRVARYRIVAPTEWNFHPRGALAAALLGTRGSRDELQRRAGWLVQALDPCVTYRLQVVDA